MWDAQQPLAQQGFRVIAWDIRGHQYSDSPDDDVLFAKTKTIDDMDAILRIHNTARVFVGHAADHGWHGL